MSQVGFSMKLGISEAARRAKVDRRVLYRLLEKGKLSKEIEDGKSVIDLSELARLYPEATNQPAQDDTVRDRPNGQSVTDGAQEVIALLKERIEALETDKADLRRERDRLLVLVEGHSATVRHLTTQAPPPTPSTTRRSLWKRLTGRHGQPTEEAS
jgi:hypothetical protein